MVIEREEVTLASFKKILRNLWKNSVEPSGRTGDGRDDVLLTVSNTDCQLQRAAARRQKQQTLQAARKSYKRNKSKQSQEEIKWELGKQRGKRENKLCTRSRGVNILSWIMWFRFCDFVCSLQVTILLGVLEVVVCSLWVDTIPGTRVFSFPPPPPWLDSPLGA
jgi:hypothetical protein